MHTIRKDGKLRLNDRITWRVHALVTAALPPAVLLTARDAAPHTFPSICQNRFIAHDVWVKLYDSADPIERWHLISGRKLDQAEIAHVTATETHHVPLGGLVCQLDDDQYEQLLEGELSSYTREHAALTRSQYLIERGTGLAQDVTSLTAAPDLAPVPTTIGQLAIDVLDRAPGQVHDRDELAVAVGKWLTSELGTDRQRWQYAIHLIDDHAGTLAELTDVCQQLAS